MGPCAAPAPLVCRLLLLALAAACSAVPCRPLPTTAPPTGVALRRRSPAARRVASPLSAVTRLLLATLGGRDEPGRLSRCGGGLGAPTSACTADRFGAASASACCMAPSTVGCSSDRPTSSFKATSSRCSRGNNDPGRSPPAAPSPPALPPPAPSRLAGLR